MIKVNENLKVIGVAGPGEPLFNKETFDFFKEIDIKYPQLLKCLSSNGLLVEDKINELITCNISSLTVTINGNSKEVLEKIYRKTVERCKISSRK